ncbi:MAG: Hpt domain-containing protein [Thermodesulfobacteriota bacterium]
MELDELSQALGLGPEEFHQFASLFVDVAVADLQRIRRALEAGRPEAVAEAAHSIKGAAATLDLTEIFQKARDLEMRGRSGDLEGAEAELEALEAQVDWIRKSLQGERDLYGEGRKPADISGASKWTKVEP